ncbi:MAG: Uma2 family endonuclease [Pirellulales bacterium]|nr:Uma2 family endonuclease [Pirellulales bacterium]
MVHLTITDAGVDLSPGSEVILRHQTWADYEELLQCRQDNAAIKVRYNARTQEIRLMAPLPKHGKNSDVLSDLVKILLRHLGREWEGFDPITLKRFGEAGLEPDWCVYIHNRNAILGKERIDLETDPPPDLALEVDATSPSSPEDYEPLRIPELWIYREDSLHIYVFDGRHYRETSDSPNFPAVPVCQWIPESMRRAWRVGSSVALRQFEDALREST